MCIGHKGMGALCLLVDLFVFLIAPFSIQAQDTVDYGNPLYVSYAYDGAGNRVARVLVIPKGKTRSVADTVDPRTETVPASFLAGNEIQGNEVVSTEDGRAGEEIPSGQAVERPCYIDQVGEIQVSLYPNPTRGSFHVRVHVDGPETMIRYSLYDMAGRLLQTGILSSAGETVIDMEGQGSGTYLFEMGVEGQRQVWRVVKQ